MAIEFNVVEMRLVDWYTLARYLAPLYTNGRRATLDLLESPNDTDYHIRASDAQILNLCMKLQDIHDMFLPCYWREELNKIACGFGLNTTVLNKTYFHE